MVFRIEEDCIGGLPSGLIPNGSDLFSFKPGQYGTDPHIAPYFHAGGLALQTLGFDGAPGAWHMAKLEASGYNGGRPFSDVVTPTTATCDGHGRCAVAGTYVAGNEPWWPVTTTPWVEVLSVP